MTYIIIIINLKNTKYIKKNINTFYKLLKINTLASFLNAFKDTQCMH